MKHGKIFSIVTLLILVFSLGCVQQAEQKSVVVDGVEYALSNDISKGMAVGVYYPKPIHDRLIGSNSINVIFDCSQTEYKPAITVAAINSVMVVQNYLVYSKQRYAKFSTFCFTEDKWYNSTNSEVAAPAPANATLLIRIANETNVLFSYNNTIIIQATDSKNLTIATDAFSLTVLGMKK